MLRSKEDGNSDYVKRIKHALIKEKEGGAGVKPKDFSRMPANP